MADPEADWWQQDADRHNELCRLAREMGLVAGDHVEPPKLNRDGSMAVDQPEPPPEPAQPMFRDEASRDSFLKLAAKQLSQHVRPMPRPMTRDEEVLAGLD